MIWVEKLVAAVVVVVAAIAGVSATHVYAGPISYTGGAYTENFESLGSLRYPSRTTWVDDSTLPGWYASGVKYLYGSIGYSVTYAGWSLFTYRSGSDSAFGSQNGDTYIPFLRFGVQLVNDTAGPLSSFTLSYFGEQWRNAGSGLVEQLSFDYGLGALSLTSGDYVAIADLDFVSPVVSATIPLGGTALDGNLAENRRPLSASISGLNWMPGESLWLRWTDVEDPFWWAGSALAIDDLVFTAESAVSPFNTAPAGVMTPQGPMSISEPSTGWLAGLCIAALAVVSRRSTKRRAGMHPRRAGALAK